MPSCDRWTRHIRRNRNVTRRARSLRDGVKMAVITPRLLVFSSLFPSAVQPNAGLFVRERMFRVGKHLPIVVVAPQPWFPGQQLIRWFRPHFRPMAPKREVMDGIVVHRPRFLCVPGFLKWTDGLFMALSSFLTVRR